MEIHFRNNQRDGRVHSEDRPFVDYEYATLDRFMGKPLTHGAASCEKGHVDAIKRFGSRLENG